ncbi:hypothetical protein [Roseibium sp. M-1]
MVHEKTGLPVNEIQEASFPPVLLFMLASTLLMLMTAMKPTLALPALAFLVMISVTSLLGRRLYQDLAVARDRVD